MALNVKTVERERHVILSADLRSVNIIDRERHVNLVVVFQSVNTVDRENNVKPVTVINISVIHVTRSTDQNKD